jgi:Domain of unknown function (DUF6285)
VQDRPDTHELAAAVAEFLASDVRPAVPRELRFQVLVAANACAILARETAAGPETERAELERLQRLAGDVEDDVRAAQAAVASRIRAGELDDRWDEAVAVLRESVRAKLQVAHPGYEDFADDGRG